MSDRREILGLWASASGPVLWVRPGRGRSVLISLAPGRAEPAINLGSAGRDKRTVVGTWDGYNGELRIPLPRLPYGAELILDYDNHSWAAEGDTLEEQLTGGVSMADVPGALRVALPPWLLSQEPYRRVPQEAWPQYGLVWLPLRKGGVALGGRTGGGGPQNNEMHLTNGRRPRRTPVPR